jgi:hypothetical protein
MFLTQIASPMPSFGSSHVSCNDFVEKVSVTGIIDLKNECWTTPVDAKAKTIQAKSLDESSEVSKNEVSADDLKVMIEDFSKFLKKFDKQKHSPDQKSKKRNSGNFSVETKAEENSNSRDIAASLAELAKPQM